jgi:hypothetical protein
MRDAVPKIALPTVRSNLEIVRDEFEGWRKTRRGRERIPEALWAAAAAQCKEHSLCEVSQTLRLNYNDLKERVRGTGKRGLAVGQHRHFDFVKLDLGAPILSSECLVEMEAPNGATMRMSFKGASREFDPVELSRAFWRQGR